MTDSYYATPYDTSATGFFFNTFEDYLEKSASHRNSRGDPVEEYEIQYIDGNNSELFSALGINQASLKIWFEEFASLDEEDAIRAIYLADYYTADRIMDQLDEADLFEGTLLEYVESYIEDTGLLDEIPEHLRYYFDAESYARDMAYGGYVKNVEIMGRSWVAVVL